MEDTDLHRAENMDESVHGEQLDVYFAAASQNITLSRCRSSGQCTHLTGQNHLQRLTSVRTR